MAVLHLDCLTEMRPWPISVSTTALKILAAAAAAAESLEVPAWRLVARRGMRTATLGLGSGYAPLRGSTNVYGRRTGVADLARLGVA